MVSVSKPKEINTVPLSSWALCFQKVPSSNIIHVLKFMSPVYQLCSQYIWEGLGHLASRSSAAGGCVGLNLGDREAFRAALPAFSWEVTAFTFCPPGRGNPDDKRIPYRWCRMRLDFPFPPWNYCQILMTLLALWRWWFSVQKLFLPFCSCVGMDVLRRHRKYPMSDGRDSFRLHTQETANPQVEGRRASSVTEIGPLSCSGNI